MSMEEFFDLVSRKMAPVLKMQYADILNLLNTREKQASTVLAPGLAIPHVILEGAESLQALIIQSPEGVVFVDDQPPVHAIFVLTASPQLRNFYLKALVAVAEIAQDAEFDRKWLAARGVEALREIILAAERRREVWEGQ